MEGIIDFILGGERPLILFFVFWFSAFVGLIIATNINAKSINERSEAKAKEEVLENTAAPVRSYPARIVSKSKRPAKAVRYFITFASPDSSEEKELAVDVKTYCFYRMELTGTLLFRQDRFICFVPKGDPLPVTYPPDTQLASVQIKQKRREKVRSVCTMRFETPDIPRLELDVDPQTYERFSEGEIGELFCHNSEFRGFSPQVLPQEDSAPVPFEQSSPAQELKDDSNQTPLY